MKYIYVKSTAGVIPNKVVANIYWILTRCKATGLTASHVSSCILKKPWKGRGETPLTDGNLEQRGHQAFYPGSPAPSIWPHVASWPSTTSPDSELGHQPRPVLRESWERHREQNEGVKDLCVQGMCLPSQKHNNTKELPPTRELHKGVSTDVTHKPVVCTHASSSQLERITEMIPLTTATKDCNV